MVERAFVEIVVKTLEMVYGVIGPPITGSVRLYIFSHTKEMEGFMGEEARRAGVEMGSIPGFSTYHWAWGGSPVITVCQENTRDKERGIWLGEIEHEGGHSILHGERRFYLFDPPLLLLNLEARRILDHNQLNTTFYLLTLTVKDYEVSRVLEEHKILENQISMHLHHLELGEEESLLWKELEGFRDPWVEMILALNQLKVMASTLPFLEHSGELRASFQKVLTSMTSKARDWISPILKTLPQLGPSTHRNVEAVAEKWASILLKEGI